jgi:hypothetical protein
MYGKGRDTVAERERIAAAMPAAGSQKTDVTGGETLLRQASWGTLQTIEFAHLFARKLITHRSVHTLNERSFNETNRTSHPDNELSRNWTGNVAGRM